MIQTSMFKFSLALTLFAGTFLASAQDKLLYLAPGEVSPDGKYALAAYAQKTNHGDWDSEVAFYIAEVQSNGALRIASDVVLDWGNEAVDIRGYGPYVAQWVANAENGEFKTEYAIVENLSRKSNLFFFMRNVNGKWEKQSYDDTRYAANRKALLEKIAQDAGFKNPNISPSYMSAHLGQTLEDNQDPEPTDISLELPFYVKSEYSYGIFSETPEKYMEVSIVSIVKVEKNAAGDLVDSLVSLEVVP